MRIHTLKRSQHLPVSLEKAWEFFSAPKNLELITPSSVKLIQLSKDEDIKKMYEGLLISYKISPFAGIYFKWITEITHVKEKEYFVDEQRFGPYAYWNHKHFFKEVKNGVEMTDFLHYKLPLGFLGGIAHAFFVKKQVEEIFDFRCKKLEELFGKAT